MSIIYRPKLKNMRSTLQVLPHIHQVLTSQCKLYQGERSWNGHYTVCTARTVRRTLILNIQLYTSRVVPHCNTAHHDHIMCTQSVLTSLLRARFCGLVFTNQNYILWCNILNIMCDAVHTATECAAARSRTFLPARFLLLILPAPGLILKFNMNQFVYPKLM